MVACAKEVATSELMIKAYILLAAIEHVLEGGMEGGSGEGGRESRENELSG